MPLSRHVKNNPFLVPAQQEEPERPKQQRRAFDQGRVVGGGSAASGAVGSGGGEWGRDSSEEGDAVVFGPKNALSEGAGGGPSPVPPGERKKPRAAPPPSSPPPASSSFQAAPHETSRWGPNDLRPQPRTIKATPPVRARSPRRENQRQRPDRDQPAAARVAAPLVVYVDAANVAHAHSSAHFGKCYEPGLLVAAHDAVSDWARRSPHPAAPASQSVEINFVVQETALANLAGKPVTDELCRRDPDGWPFVQVPARSADDEFILLLARDKEEECGRGNVKILSNDNFDDYVEGVGSRGVKGVTAVFLDRVRWKFAVARGGAVRLAPAGSGTVAGTRR